jgi:hypothetical protein
MIRILVREVDVCDAANTGAPPAITFRTYDVEIPAVEATLLECRGATYTRREVVGVELLFPRGGAAV